MSVGSLLRTLALDHKIGEFVEVTWISYFMPGWHTHMMKNKRGTINEQMMSGVKLGKDGVRGETGKLESA